MRFSTEAERLAHPQARLITGLLWYSPAVFNGRYISDVELEMMTLDLSTLGEHEERLKWDINQQLKCWLCLLLGHPSATPAELLASAKTLCLPSNIIVQGALLTNRINMLEIIETNTPAIHTMIANEDYLVFRSAALYGYLDVLNWLKANAPDKLHAMVASRFYEAINFAAFNNHVDVLNWLKAEVPDTLQTMIAAQHYLAFCSASRNGHQDTLNWLKAEAPETLQAMIAVKCYNPFRLAARYGHWNSLNWLKAEAPDKLQAMITADDYEAFRYAARNGHIDALNWLKAEAPDKLHAMISAQFYEAFRSAASNNHSDTLMWFKAEVPDKLQAMIASEDYDAFSSSARNGYLDILKWLKAEVPNQMHIMIEAKDYESFCASAANGHLDVLKWLKAQAPDTVQIMITAQQYAAFRFAAANGHLNILNWLKSEAPEQLQAMIIAQNYEAFRSAGANGYLDVLKWLKAELPGQWQAMIMARGYETFRCAAANGHLDILYYLKTEAPEQWHAMITARSYEAFRYAIQNSHQSVIEFLLSSSHCFAYAEIHEREYHRIIHPYMNEKMSSLRSQRLIIEATTPTALFDITDAEQARVYFYMIRNFIRRNSLDVLAEIQFLLEIPALQTLAYASVNQGEPNELLRLALNTGNRAAADVLLAIPEVSDLAERHDFYQAELHGVLDLRALARDHESSMRALTPGEQSRLAAALDYYQPIIQATGINILFEHLCEELVARYEENPARIGIDDAHIILPVNWEAFSELNLNHEDQHRALKAYYQHKDHTALRYLSRPNPWIANDASYVYIDTETGERWSTFEEYKSLIVMFWLATKDSSIAYTNDHSVEDRVTHFIDELALIGRAHNWDHSRIRIDGSGSPKLDTAGHTILEEYDDLSGDKPSCFSGVKRRLFQSVSGHPLLNILKEEDIKQELRDFVRTYFSSLITDDNRVSLMNAWNSYCATLELSDAAPLRFLNLNNEQKEQFFNKLSIKYGAQFNDHISFRLYIEREFTLREKPSIPSDSMHALKFSGLVNLEQLLRPPLARVTSTATAFGFFAEERTTPLEVNTRCCSIM